MWRWAHLLFAVSIMLLVMTGITLLYPTTAWAPVLERAMGGPEIAGIIHRVAAVVMVAVFAWHILYAAIHIARNWATFKVFGPYSLMPNWQDATDFVAMFKWFFGRRPRGRRSTIGTISRRSTTGRRSGASPCWSRPARCCGSRRSTAAYLPGWMFNVATVAHGDEALLAAAYLFTVHYFVNHWRPDKFPLDIVIFTGSMPLDEFKREYAVEYARLGGKRRIAAASGRRAVATADARRQDSGLCAGGGRTGAAGDDGDRVRRQFHLSA